MAYLGLLLIILIMLWVVNTSLSMKAMTDRVDSLRNKGDDWYTTTRGAGDVVFNYYNPFSVDSWFGFKRWVSGPFVSPTEEYK